MISTEDENGSFTSCKNLFIVVILIVEQQVLDFQTVNFEFISMAKKMKRLSGKKKESIVMPNFKLTFNIGKLSFSN